MTVGGEDAAVITGHSVRFTSLDDNGEPIGDPVTWTPANPLHLEIDNEDIGEVVSGEMFLLSPASITINVDIERSTFDWQALLRVMGFPGETRSALDYYRQRNSLEEGLLSPNAQTQTTRQRAYIGDPCDHEEGNHQSHFVDSHWVCLNCRKDTCLRGDCPDDAEADQGSVDGSQEWKEV